MYFLTIHFSSETTKEFDDVLLEELKQMIDEFNPYAKVYRMARDRIDLNNEVNIQLKLIGKRATDGRTYNMPSASEVAALIVGDIGSSCEERDIIIENRSGLLKRISELHPSYLALQYPLIFVYGEDGYRIGINHRGLESYSSSNSNQRIKLTMREWFAYRLMDRENEADTILRSGKLFQQFIVDGWTMIESERLFFVRKNQTLLRAENYNSLLDSNSNGIPDLSNTGRRVVLPSTFHGGDRFMTELYHDAMGICKTYGYPDLFITFTCNSKWPEISRFVKKRNLRPEDRPDILCRVFKLKLDQLLKDITKGSLFGKANAGLLLTLLRSFYR